MQELNDEEGMKEENSQNNDRTLAFGDKSSFVDIKKGDVLSAEADSKLKERLCCIELANNNRIYLRYELRWTIKRLILNIVNHFEFKKLYPNRNWIFNSQNHLPLFDVHLALYRKIKNDNETKIDFNVTFDDLHKKDLLKNPKYPFFIFKDNRNNGELIKFHEDKVEYLQKIKDNKYETFLMYKDYLPRVNSLNILNCHPEFEKFFQSAKSAIYQLSEYNINPLIYEKKQIQEKNKKKSKKKDKKKDKSRESSARISTAEKENEEDDDEVQNTQGDLDWFVYDDESMNFLTSLDKEEFKLSSNIKFPNKKDQNNKVIFEDVYESTQLKDNELKNMFVEVSYPTDKAEGNNKEVTMKFKLNMKTNGYELCENMRKKIGQMNKNLDFDPSKKILKVKSLNDYVLNMKTPLSQYAYINECVMRNKVPQYLIMDDPLIGNIDLEDFDDFQPRETISIGMKDNSSSKKDLDKFVGISSSISSGKIKINTSKSKNLNKIKDNSNDDLVLFIDSIEESLKKHNVDEILVTQKTIEKKEKEFLELSSIVAEDTFMRQEESIFDDDDILLQIQSKLGSRTSNLNQNQTLFALNNGNLPNNRPSVINPNFFRQSTVGQ